LHFCYNGQKFYVYAQYHIDACIQMGGTFIMDKCPYCGADTRPGDNFCLNCGNRLLPATPSPSDQQAGIGEATVATPEDWNASALNAAPAGSVSWGADQAAAPAAEAPTMLESAPAVATAQATMDKIAEPGYLVLRSDSGEALQEYPLDKAEVVIGRAPNSEILLSKDKLTSRRHAIVSYENGQYLLQDEHSANGTFVNAQQLEEGTPYLLQDGDHVGIGEHELVFRASSVKGSAVEDLPTVSVPYNSAQPETAYSGPADVSSVPTSRDEYSTYATSLEPDANEEPAVDDPAELAPEVASASSADHAAVPTSSYEEPAISGASDPALAVPSYQSGASSNGQVDAGEAIDESVPDDGRVTFSRFSAIAVPPLPDMSSLMAALSSLDGQIMSLQGQFNATQDALKRHDTEIVQTASQLRDGIGRISDRLENTIADVARSREALAWAELLQLMEDVMNNPRDIEYVTKLARKARELNKVFQIHQNVLNTMAECNNQLRSLIDDAK
jgi:pSer/pThr/pTyr-binding forkhead associated (FHA) protein